jgi:hypothetical protein
MRHVLARSRGPAALLAALIAASIAGCGGGGGGGGGAGESVGTVGGTVGGSVGGSVGGTGGGSGSGLPPITGGGTDGTGSPAVAFSSGTMVRGSVILNGVRYEDGGAQVDDDRGRGVAGLATGMQVTLRGRIGDDGASGTAERVSITPELRGTVESVDRAVSPPAFVVGGVRVQTDDATVFADGLSSAGLAAGQRIEVHALRDAAGRLRATRLEPLVGTSVPDELRGAIVAGLSGGRFAIAAGPGASISVAAAASGVTWAPAGCGEPALVAGRVVEVHGAFGAGGTFTASRIECEDLADDARGLTPPAGARNELEGFVAGLDATQSTFRVGAVTVRRTAATQIRRGTLADLVNGAQVEVDGTRDGGTLVAREISFKRDQIRVQGAIQSIAGSTGFVVLGRTIRRDALTDFDLSPDRFRVGESVEIRGAIAADGAILAAEVDEGSGSDGREILQAPVTVKSGATITLLGTTLTLPANAVYRRADGTAFASLQAFLDAIVASPTGGTLVKVRGTPLSTRIEEAELQN